MEEPSNQSRNRDNFFIRSKKTPKPHHNLKPKPKRNLEQDESSQVKTKKPFDKKKWRLQKYSKKYKLEQWEEKRKKAVLHEYYKQIKDDQPSMNVEDIYKNYQEENENNLNSNINSPRSIDDEGGTSTSTKRKSFKKHERIADDKKKRKEELERKRAERAEALKVYKKNKLEKFKKLNKKTKKGQPVMKYRMEMLLEQIQKSVSN